jgi:hypothetical protein
MIHPRHPPPACLPHHDRDRERSGLPQGNERGWADASGLSAPPAERGWVGGWTRAPADVRRNNAVLITKLDRPTRLDYQNVKQAYRLSWGATPRKPQNFYLSCPPGRRRPIACPGQLIKRWRDKASNYRCAKMIKRIRILFTGCIS